LQDAENKKSEKKEVIGPPLQTASSSVRALIEEKIIQKRTTGKKNGEARRRRLPTSPVCRKVKVDDTINRSIAGVARHQADEIIKRVAAGIPGGGEGNLQHLRQRHRPI